MNTKEIVAIVGRPNVGKSTLFNRLVGMRKAIEDNVSGVTRDRIYAEAEWQGVEFMLIDTGGYVPSSDDVFESAIREQVDIALQEATRIVFVTDVTCSITYLDEQIVKMLRKSKKDVYLVVNKVDNGTRQLQAAEFYSLGIEKTFFLSSINGSGTGEFLDELTKQMSVVEQEQEEAEIPKLVILGQPNVGKSTLLNSLVGEKRNVVTDIAGTTRDAIHTHYNLFNKELMLIDTAGIRRKNKVEENLEFYSVIRAIRVIDEADVCLLVLDATKGIVAQDLNLFQIIVKKKRGLVLLINKWDLIEKDHRSLEEYRQGLIEKIAPFTDIPIVFISALEKKRIFKALEIALEVHENRKLKVSTSKLNELLARATEKHHHPAIKRKEIKIKYATQIPTRYPAFVFFCNHPHLVKLDYKQYLENMLRQNFNLTGVPIDLFFRKK